jgi:hypothetical protein
MPAPHCLASCDSIPTSNLSIETRGVNGPRRLTLTRVPPGWALQEVRAGGIDVTDRPLPFGRREQSLNGVEVIVTNRITELSGTIVAADAHGAQAVAVIVFATTDHHGDHAYGNPVWTRLSAITLAHVGVANEMKRYEPQRWRETAKARQDVAELILSNPEPPRQTFCGDKFVLDDGTRKVEFHFFGWAHTRGGGFVYLPNEKILCTGDAVANGPYNYLRDGNSANWPAVIGKAQRLGVITVLPGHGPQAAGKS